MLAIDTNVIVRALTGDDPDQAARARALIEREDVWVATTVMLECEWVLRSAYGLSTHEVNQALAAFAGLPQVRLQEPERFQRALALAADGMDFADALHLAAAAGLAGFKTFDQRLIRRAKTIAETAVSEP